MPKVDIWMPIYIGDYLRDTQELTAEEHGVYILLLMHYWQKKGDIGSDIKRLAVVTRSSEETTKGILDSFFTFEDGRYKNKRADEELKAANTRSESARGNARKRWDNAPAMPGQCGGNAPAYAPGDAECHAESMPNGCSSSSSSSSSSKSPSKEESADKPHRVTFQKPTVEEIWAYCRERRNGISPEHFFDFYEAKGWLVGKSKMKDWKAAVRNWERNSFDKSPSTSVNQRPDAWTAEDIARKRAEDEGKDVTAEDLAEVERIKASVAGTPVGRMVVSMLGDGRLTS